jgi:hypothetical protein
MALLASSLYLVAGVIEGQHVSREAERQKRREKRSGGQGRLASQRKDYTRPRLQTLQPCCREQPESRQPRVDRLTWALCNRNSTPPTIVHEVTKTNHTTRETGVRTFRGIQCRQRQRCRAEGCPYRGVHLNGAEGGGGGGGEERGLCEQGKNVLQWCGEKALVKHVITMSKCGADGSRDAPDMIDRFCRREPEAASKRGSLSGNVQENGG